MVQWKNKMEKVIPERQDTGVNKVLLSSFYLAPIEYYGALFHAQSALIEIEENYRKQSYRNRCIIGGPNGALSLSIPIVKPGKEKSKMKDIRIADHGEWQHLHWNAIISAYNSTPFFQYYEDDFRPFYEKKFEFLHDFNEQLRHLICHLIGIETRISYTSEYLKDHPDSIMDMRDTIDPKKGIRYSTPEYYQVFEKKTGFIPNLSIIDLLFNMGNETRLYLIENTFR